MPILISRRKWCNKAGTGRGNIRWYWNFSWGPSSRSFVPGGPQRVRGNISNHRSVSSELYLQSTLAVTWQGSIGFGQAFEYTGSNWVHFDYQVRNVNCFLSLFCNLRSVYFHFINFLLVYPSLGLQWRCWRVLLMIKFQTYIRLLFRYFSSKCSHYPVNIGTQYFFLILRCPLVWKTHALFPIINGKLLENTHLL